MSIYDALHDYELPQPRVENWRLLSAELLDNAAFPQELLWDVINEMRHLAAAELRQAEGVYEPSGRAVLKLVFAQPVRRKEVPDDDQ